MALLSDSVMQTSWLRVSYLQQPEQTHCDFWILHLGSQLLEKSYRDDITK